MTSRNSSFLDTLAAQLLDGRSPFDDRAGLVHDEHSIGVQGASRAADWVIMGVAMM